MPDTARTVRCVGGRQPAPPEDTGGVYGYGALLVALNDPDHPDFAMARQVLGEAAAFDVATVDARLRDVPVS